MNIYIVQGGIGKHVMFSSLIEKLSERDGEKIMILSPYPDLFKFHPQVELSGDFAHPGFYDKYIKGTENNVLFQEPYFSNYAKGESHLIQCWAELYGLKYEYDLPDIYVDDFATEECERFVEQFPEFIVVQFSGGQSPINADLNRPFQNIGQIKDYPREMAQEVVNKIKEKYENMTIVNYAMPNEATYNLENTVHLETPYLFYVALLQHCKSFISIDSSLQHFAANRYNQKNGVVLWGSTGPIALGYGKNINLTNKTTEEHTHRPLTSTLGDLYNEDGSPWKHEDIDCIKVDPDEIVKSLELSIDYNEGIELDESNVVVNSSIIDINEKTRNMLAGLEAQMNEINTKYQTVIDAYIASQDKEGKYNLSRDGKKLIKVG
jgi:hypothetical protein